MSSRADAAILADGQWVAGDAVVHWRLGRLDDASRARATADAWLREVASTAGLQAWHGIERPARFVKPRLAQAPGWDASVSHSAGHVLVATAHGVRLGADVESAPFRAFASPALRRRMCSPAEHARARRLDGVRREAYLAQVWTAKEALAKASGQGLAVDFRSLDVQPRGALGTAPVAAHLAVLGAAGPLLARVSPAGDAVAFRPCSAAAVGGGA